MFIAAAMWDRVLPVTFPVPAPHKVTGWLFEWWFLWCLLPSLPIGTVIVLDNALVHRKAILKAMSLLYGMSLVSHTYLTYPRSSAEATTVRI